MLCTLVSRNVLVREGLKALLMLHVPRARVHECQRLRDLVSDAAADVADIIVFDAEVALPDPAGTLRRLRRVAGQARIGVVIARPQRLLLRAFVGAGVDAVMLFDSAPDDLGDALLALAEGRAWFVPGAQAQLVRALREPEPVLARLSSRELELIRLLGEGLSNKEIARQLGITEGTVKSHVRRVRRRLAARDRTQVVLHALRLGLVAFAADDDSTLTTAATACLHGPEPRRDVSIA